MIIIRYLVKETLKSQVAILFILSLIFFCQKLVKILSAVVSGDVPTNLIFALLGLGVSEMVELILPLSLFLGVLMTFGRLYMESEIAVMHACGLGKDVLIKAALILAFITSALAAGNVILLGPWSSIYQDEVLAEAKANPSMAALVEGQFQTSSDGNTVLYVGKVKSNTFNNVFLAQLGSQGDQRPSVVVADGGYIVPMLDGTQIINLTKGTRFEGSALLRDFRVSDFYDYQAVLGYKDVEAQSNGIDQKSMSELLAMNNHQSLSEFHWRLTLIFSALIMGIMVVPLSVVNPRQGRVLSMLPAILLYLIFFLLQSSLHSNGSKGRLDPALGMWATNIGFLIVAILLNTWDTLPMRKLRSSLRGHR